MAEFSHLGEEDRALIGHLLDLGARSLGTQSPVHADFLDPHQREIASRELAVLTGLRCLYYGGFRRAERQRLILTPDFLLVEAIDPRLGFLEIKPADASDLTHQDYLGAVLSLGVKREKIGDLIVLADRCQMVAVQETATYLLANLARIGRTKAAAILIEPEQLQVPPEQIKEIKTTVASPRLDAVASDGFGTSRTRMVREIKAGRVRVNWQPSLNPDRQLQEGDVISIRGRGRVIVAAVTGETKKGRMGLLLKRLI